MFTYNDYVQQVLDEEIAAPEYVIKACRRHRDDLVTGHARGIYFDADAAHLAILFFHSLLHHWKGSYAGEKVHLEPWQQFLTASLFGWKNGDGLRRFRTAYITVPRKNGKTTWAAGVGLYLMVADGEPGAEVYAAATKKDQARISHKDATEMVKKSPLLKKEIGIFKNNLHHVASASLFEPLASDTDSLDGLNVHGVIADELHAWKKRLLWDVLDTATGSREQPLIVAITTAGFNRQSICYQLHEYTQKILDGIIDDDTFFGLIYAPDEGDDWQDRDVWYKVNPNLGVSKKLDDMERKAQKAEAMPAFLDAFMRLELNQWTQAENRWIHPEKWAALAGKIDLESLKGRTCYAGLDLSSTTDISALVLVFPPEKDDDAYIVLPFFWVPEENAAEREMRDRVPYLSWARNGFLTLTPGNVIDYDFIQAVIVDLVELYDIREIAYDRWGATKLVTSLVNLGLTMVPFGQGFASMAAPMRELEGLILGNNLVHGGHPVLSWMAHNVVATSDPAGNLKPDKAKSTEKIDGIVGLVMALGRAIVHGTAASVYDEAGIMVV